MKTNVHGNSMESYHSLDLTKRQLEVVQAFEELKEATDIEIANHLGYTVNRVTGRITELKEKGVLIEYRTVIGKFNKLVRVCCLASYADKLKEMDNELLFGRI